MRRIVWTRAAEDWPSDEPWLAEARAAVIRVPCITTREVPFTLPREEPELVILTSPKAATIALGTPALRARIGKARACLTFGQTTTQLLVSHGITVEQLAEASDGASLARAISQRIDPAARIEQLGPKAPAYDVIGALGQRGYQASYVAIYETVPVASIGESETSAMLAADHAYVCLASPSAVNAFAAAWLKKHPATRERLTAVAIGTTTERACRGQFTRIVVADEASVAALARTAIDLLA